MGAIATLAENWTRRSTSSSPSQWLVDWISGGTSSSSGMKVNAQKAMQYAPFWAAVRVISGTVAALPFAVYRRSADGGKVKQARHPIYALLHDRPNEYVDAVTFIETRQAHVLTYGNGYAEIQRDNSGKPVALWPLLPNRTQRKVDLDGIPYYEVRPQAGQTVRLPDYNVLHIKGLGFDGYTGYDVVTFHKEALGYGMAVKEYGSRFFANNANPGGVLEHPGRLSENAGKKLMEMWNKAHSGLSQAHRLQVLEEGMKWHPIGVEPDKAQAIEVQKFTVDDCARIFNIPPHKLASLDKATFCMPADVEVYTENGPKSIAGVRIGEKVWSLDENEQWVLSPILRSGCTGEDELLHIRTTNRAFRANARHRVLIRRKYLSPRADRHGYQYETEWRNEYVPAGELHVGDRLVTANGDFGTLGYSLAGIISIESEPPEKVYNLKVEGTHTFVANGVVVHNSNIEEQNIDFLMTTMLYWFRKWEQECNHKLFMPSERGSMFCEIMFAGMLRGNVAARSSSYGMGRQWGYYSINDIRRMENLNPIGPEGDVYLDPLNMVPAGMQAPNPPAVDEAHRRLIVSQCERLVTKHVKALQKPIKSGFYERQRNYATRILTEPAMALASVRSVEPGRVRNAIDKVVPRYIRADLRLGEDCAELMADELMQEIGGNNHAR